MPGFEFDEGKSKTNQEKHGIDFTSAQKLWQDPDLLEFQAKSDDEHRFLVIGLIGAKHLVCCYHLQKGAYSLDFCT